MNYNFLKTNSWYDRHKFAKSNEGSISKHLKKVDKMKQQMKVGNGLNNTSMGIYIDL
jgi:hypothetical protein